MDASEPTEPLKEERTSNDKGKAKPLPGSTQPRDAFIAVMGDPGSGKSTFMNTWRVEDVVDVESEPMSETPLVADGTFEHNGVKIHLIEIPGFADSMLSNAEILTLIASYFAATYSVNIEMNGIIYISAIKNPRMSGTAIRNLNLFSKMIGNDASSKVVLATSGWDMVQDQSEAEVREKQLREGSWRPFIENGSKVCRLDGGREAAFHILDVLLPGGAIEGRVLQIQRELVDDMKTIDETEAGQELSKEILKLQEEFRRKQDSMESMLNGAIAARDYNMVRYLRTEQAQLERKISQAEDERKWLRVDFRRWAWEQWGMHLSTIRQREMERMEEAVVIEKLSTGLRAVRAQLQQNENYRTTESPDIGEARSQQFEADQSSIQILEDELEKAQEDDVAKEAGMMAMRGLVLGILTGTVSSPPPAYTQSTISRESSGIAGRQTHSQKAPSDTSDEAKKGDKFRSYFARNQNQRSQQGPESELESNVRADRFHRARANLRVVDEERRQLRAELYQNSLLSFEQGTDPEKESSSSLQRGSTGMRDVREVEALCKQYQLSIGDQKELQDILSHALTAMGTDTLTSGAWLLYQTYFLRNGILAVYLNCRRLQTAELAGFWFSMLVLEPPSNNRTRVINLSRVNVEDIREVVERLSHFVTDLQYIISKRPNGLASVSNLTRLSEEVHLLYQNIFKRLGLEDFLSHQLDRSDLATELESILNSQSSGESAYFVDILAQWWCATRALDVGIVAYESGHISNLEQTSRITLGAFKLRDTPQGAERSRSLQYIPRGLNCLAGFFQKHDVWVLATEEASNNLYLAADIETFADVWGPVWKVVDQSRPELIAKYNVRGGSIVPLPSYPDVHSKLRPNERLCHWESNAEYIHHHCDEGSANDESSSSSSGSDETEGDSDETEGDPDETGEDSGQATSFSGNEILVIGADEDACFQWYDCHCSLNAIRQDLENAGRLDRMIASKSYRYIDSQQKSLVGGSHGVQAGVGWTVKDKGQEPLKVGLLERWENELDLRDPREFENIWGIAVSICTMNAQRMRLVELFGEDSVVALLRHFKWSGSYQRKSFLDAIRSTDPYALGDLWEDNPDWRTSLGNAILICLRILFKTGYNENRDEFHVLWLPPGCRDPRRVTLKPSDQGWTKFLKDTTYSITVAVIMEDSLGTGPCNGHRRRWFKYPSILETSIYVNWDVSPAQKLIKSRDTNDKYSYIPRRDGGRWRRILDVSDIKYGEQFWMRSQNRLRTMWPLNSRHLLLEMDPVKREKFQALIGLKPTEHWKGHWEYTDTELNGDGIRPIPVHITS